MIIPIRINFKYFGVGMIDFDKQKSSGDKQQNYNANDNKQKRRTI